jgi:hypothetical protein
MQFDLWQSTRIAVGCVLLSLFAFSPNINAQTPVVSQADIHKELVNSSQTRQKNLEKVQNFISTGIAQKSSATAKIDSARVNAAVSTLSDAELAQLASRADKIQSDFAAGRLSERDLLLIILGFAALILIIVAVR